MKRSMLAGLSVVLLSAGLAPAALAQTNNPTLDPNNPSMEGPYSNPSTSPYSTPSASPYSSPSMGADSSLTMFEPNAVQVVNLARNGYFEDQGIPGFSRLRFNYQTNDVTAEDVIQAAVDAGRISQEQRDSDAFEQAVEVEMYSLFAPGRNH